MGNELESMSQEGVGVLYTPAERDYLLSLKNSSTSKKYSCVTGCTNCVSCGGND